MKVVHDSVVKIFSCLFRYTWKIINFQTECFYILKRTVNDA